MCKCAKKDVLCKKGPCKFFAHADEDALDYCDKVFEKVSLSPPPLPMNHEELLLAFHRYSTSTNNSDAC